MHLVKPPIADVAAPLALQATSLQQIDKRWQLLRPLMALEPCGAPKLLHLGALHDGWSTIEKFQREIGYMGTNTADFDELEASHLPEHLSSQTISTLHPRA
jgi:hypothetical protein